MGGDASRTRAGRSLAAMLRTGPVSVGEAVRLTSVVADEVSALHAAGRAHTGIDPSTVLVDADGTVRLDGPPAPKTGLAAPPALRADDLRGVGRVLAAALGWSASEALPAPIAELVLRAEATNAPAAALAEAVRRLEREPLAVAALLPHRPVPARRAAAGALARTIPHADRRTAGVAAVVVAGAAAVGAVLLLIGTPASTVPPAAAAATARATGPSAADRVADAADSPHSSLRAVLGAVPRPTPPLPPKVVRRPTAVDAEVAEPAITRAAPAAGPTPTAAPTAAAPTPTASPSAPGPAPQPTQDVTSAPAAGPTAEPVPSVTAAPPSTEPAAASPTGPAPDPTPETSAPG